MNDVSDNQMATMDISVVNVTTMNPAVDNDSDQEQEEPGPLAWVARVSQANFAIRPHQPRLGPTVRTPPPYPRGAEVLTLIDLWHLMYANWPGYYPWPQKPMDKVEFLIFTHGFYPELLQDPEKGLELCLPRRIHFTKGQPRRIPMGVAFNFPDGYYGELVPGIRGPRIPEEIAKIRPRYVYTSKKELVLSVTPSKTFTPSLTYGFVQLTLKGKPTIPPLCESIRV